MKITRHFNAARTVRNWLLLTAACLYACGDEPSAADMMAMNPSDPSSPSAADPSKPSTMPGSDPMQVADKPVPTGEPVTMENLDKTLFPQLNSTSFETAKPEEGVTANRGVSTNGFAGAESAADGNAAAPPVSAAAGTPAPTGATPSPMAPTPQPQAGNPGAAAAMREIVEADVVQAQGDTLYVLNRYRGLVLVDMSVPDSPYVRGRVPFQAQPVDMYLRDGKAYIVMSDYFTYWQFDQGSDPLGFHGSQLLVVDVQDASHPTVAGSFAINGEVTDTRIVGDVLYTVSKRNPDYWRYDTEDWHDTTWVSSIDVSNPAQIHQVETKEFPGSANLIQVYETALSVAATDPNYYLVDDLNAQQTLITYVDISDPKGAIRVGGTAYVPGSVQDKFKMDLSQGQLRVISQNWYWHPDAAATLSVFDASDPAKLTPRAKLELTSDVPVNNNSTQAQATRFSGTRLFLTLCWYDNGGQHCKLDLYDLTNAAAPKRAGVLPVDGPITHFEVRDNRLLALGTHQLSQFDPSVVQIALYDVANLAAPKRLSAVDLGGDGSSSEALSDYKAFKVLPELNLLLLPLNWVEGPNRSIYRSGAQLVDWQNDQLTVRGRVAQRGGVERVLSFHDRILSISTNQIQVIDARDRSRPVPTASLFLVRDVVDVFRIKGYQVQLAASEEDQTYSFYVLPFGEDDMAKSVAELPVDTSLFYQMQDGDIVHLVGIDPTNGEQLIRNADFSDPLKPRWRGLYRIPAEIQHIYNGGYGRYFSFYDYYWNPQAGQPLNNSLLPATVRDVNTGANGRRFYKNTLRMIDLRDADNPKLAAGGIEMPDWPFVNRVGHGKTLFSTHTEPALDKNGNPKKYHERYFLDRVDAADPANLKLLAKVNIPGRLVDVDESGTILYTVDYQWDEHGRRRNSFNVLKLDNDTATLKVVLPVGDEIDRARFTDREVWLSSHGYPWWGRSDDTADSRQPYTRLTRLRFDMQGQLASNVSHDVDGYHFDLLDVEASKVYLASSYPTGLLMLDTTDLEKPMVIGAARTVGYVSKILHEGDWLYMPMSSYGVRRMSAK